MPEDDDDDDAPAPRAGQPLSRADIAKLLQVASSAVVPLSSQSNLVRHLFERASVLGTFTLQQLTQGLAQAPETRWAAEEVLRDSVVVPNEGRRQWLLSPSSRRATLAQLGNRALALLGEVAREQSDPLGRAMAALIRGAVAPAAEMSTQELRAFTAAGEWLRDWSGLARERMAQWRAELQRRELIEPLARIAEGFVGRDKDMAALRAFVDIAPPASRFEGWSRWVKNLVGSSKDPLMVHGIGGIGKSTLMAHFIVTHATVSSERGFPFAYLDFDRARLDPGNPGTLLNELLGQVSAQFPGMASHREDWSRRLQSEQRRGRVEQLSRSSASNFGLQAADSSTSLGLTELFASWLHGLGLADRPFLLVLDTFEEVQIRGASAVDSVFDLIKGLSVLPQLRVVIAGRAPIEERPVTGHPLGNFDKKAALAFLRAQDLPRGLPETIFDKVGGNPLALRLAVQLVRQHAFGTVRKEDLESLFGKKNGLYIQGYLYTRLLRHIGDKRVEKLAHPGLVLRRITPDILGAVLVPELMKQPDSGLEGASLQDLYQALKREVSLVVEEDGALVHRKDVRSVMLEMQRQDKPAIFDALNRAAADYYAQHDPQSPLSRRERAYHLLMLEDVDPVVAVSALDRDDLLTLCSASEELPTQSRAVVRALLGQGLTAKERGTLPDPVWSTYAYRRGLALLAAGSPEDAMTLFHERPKLVERGAVRYPLALALFNLLEWDQAEQLLRDPLDASSAAAVGRPGSREDVELRIRPLIEAGFLAWYRDDPKRSSRCFKEAVLQAQEAGTLFLSIEGYLGMSLLGASPHRSIGFQQELLLRKVRPSDWRQNLLTLRRVVFLGAAPPFLMRTAVLHLGVQLRNPKILHRLLSELGPRLSADTRSMAKAMQQSPLDGDNTEQFVSLERTAGAELAKLASGDEQIDATPYLRGRFAPWKIPLRSALLYAYPEAGDLRATYADLYPAPAQRLGDRVRSPRALADAIIDYADQRGTLLQMAQALLTHARAPEGLAHGTGLLLDAMQRYTNQGPALDADMAEMRA